MNETTVADVMSTELVTVTAHSTAAAAAQRMLDEDIGSIVVIDSEQRLVGLLTATDFVQLVYENDPEDETPVEACMTTDVRTAAPGDTLAELKAMADLEYTHLPVVDDEVVVGIVSTTDLTAHVARR